MEKIQIGHAELYTWIYTHTKLKIEEKPQSKIFNVCVFCKHSREGTVQKARHTTQKIWTESLQCKGRMGANCAKASTSKRS